MNSKVRSMPLAKKELEELHNAEHCALLHGGSGIFVIVHALNTNHSLPTKLTISNCCLVHGFNDALVVAILLRL